MLEWLKRHAWKACKRRNRFRGSNPRLSADYTKGKPQAGFPFFFADGQSAFVHSSGSPLPQKG